MPTAHVGRRRPSRVLLQNTDDLLLAEPPLTHVVRLLSGMADSRSDRVPDGGEGQCPSKPKQDIHLSLGGSCAIGLGGNILFPHFRAND